MRTRTELRKQIYEEFKEIFDLTNELLRIAQTIMVEMNKKGGLKEDSQNHEKAVAILFGQAYSRFLAVKLLCEDGMGDASLIVLRSLLNLFIMFYWILKKQREARAKRYIGWYWKELKSRIRLAPGSYDIIRKREAQRNYRSLRHLYTYTVKDRAAGIRKRVQAKFWYAPWTIERMAKDVGLENHYENGYRILSWVEHVDPTHALLKVKTGKIVLDPGFDKKILSESLIMNFSYFREICATINKTFSLGQSDVLRHLAGRQRSFKRR